MRVFRRAFVMEHVPCEGEVFDGCIFTETATRAGKKCNFMFTGILYRRRNGAVYWFFSFYGLEKRKGMDFAADVSRLSKGILNERLQVLIACVARWLVVHMY